MVEVQGVTKRYGPVVAVQDATFSVAAGETVGFLGPNGAGKTTTMRIMTGLFPPSSGDVRVAGFSIATDPLEVKRRVGYLPENTPVYQDMRVNRYLRFVAEIKGVPSGQRAAQIETAVESCGLREMYKRSIRALSKGYRQRVGLAQALIGDPAVIILDEPTSGLDPTQTFEFRNLVRGMKGQRTIILSTHILPEVSAVCDRVVIIAKGRIVAQDTPEALARSLTQVMEFVVTLEAEPQAALRLLEAVDGVATAVIDQAAQSARPDAGGTVRIRVTSTPHADPRGAITRAVVNAGWNITELNVVAAGLEEVFLNLVTQEPEPTMEGQR